VCDGLAAMLNRKVSLAHDAGYCRLFDRRISLYDQVRGVLLLAEPKEWLCLVNFFGLMGFITMAFHKYRMSTYTDDRAYLDLRGQGSLFTIAGSRFCQPGAWRVYNLVIHYAYQPGRCQVLRMNVHVWLSQYSCSVSCIAAVAPVSL
jgi:hypothetical protein